MQKLSAVSQLAPVWYRPSSAALCRCALSKGTMEEITYWCFPQPPALALRWACKRRSEVPICTMVEQFAVAALANVIGSACDAYSGAEYASPPPAEVAAGYPALLGASRRPSSQSARARGPSHGSCNPWAHAFGSGRAPARKWATSVCLNVRREGREAG